MADRVQRGEDEITWHHSDYVQKQTEVVII